MTGQQPSHFIPSKKPVQTYWHKVRNLYRSSCNKTKCCRVASSLQLNFLHSCPCHEFSQNSENFYFPAPVLSVSGSKGQNLTVYSQALCLPVFTKSIILSVSVFCNRFLFLSKIVGQDTNDIVLAILFYYFPTCQQYPFML